MNASGTLIDTEEQQLLRSAARELVATRAPLAASPGRRVGDEGLDGDRRLWHDLAELGWVGITLPPEHGGSGGTLGDLAVILDALGGTLCATPFISTVVLGGGLIRSLGSVAQRDALIPAIANGSVTVAVAFQDGDHLDGDRDGTIATPVGDGRWKIRGAKRLVLDGPSADQLLVTARTVEGFGAFLLPIATEGLTVRPRRLIDQQLVADVTLADVIVDPSALLGDPGSAGVAVDQALDAATVALCCEMLGSTRSVFELTVQYLKDRRQFGVPIGSFQALQHRAATMHCEIELAHSLVREAVDAVDNDRSDRAALASAAKAMMNDLFLRVSSESIQLHGGMGMTHEAAPGLYLKRARVTAALLGDSGYHRRRFARLLQTH